jgi:hypothetical protein
VIKGNLIGLDVNGALGVGNKQDGIRLDLGTANNTIGGAGAAGNDVVASTGAGIDISTSSSTARRRRSRPPGPRPRAA